MCGSRWRLPNLCSCRPHRQPSLFLPLSSLCKYRHAAVPQSAKPLVSYAWQRHRMLPWYWSLTSHAWYVNALPRCGICHAG